MSEFQEYEKVRIKRLEQPQRYIDGSANIKRQPQIGDVDTIVFMLDNSNCIVECVNKDGFTVWLADFNIAELERVSD